MSSEHTTIGFYSLKLADFVEKLAEVASHPPFLFFRAAYQCFCAPRLRRRVSTHAAFMRQ
jgi:hypothetical protein